MSINFLLLLLSLSLPFCFCGVGLFSGFDLPDGFDDFFDNEGDGSTFPFGGSNFYGNNGNSQGNTGGNNRNTGNNQGNSRGNYGNTGNNQGNTGGNDRNTGNNQGNARGNYGSTGNNQGNDRDYGNAGNNGNARGSPLSRVDPDISDIAPPCFDKKSVDTCISYKNHGYCNRQNQYYDYMMNNCKKTCGFCNNKPDDTQPNTPTNGGNCAGVVCPRVRCSRDEVLSQDDRACCPHCVRRPNRGCTPIYRLMNKKGMLYNGQKCDTLSPIVVSGCFGVCASASILLEGGHQFKRCQCCEASEKRKATTVLRCWTSTGPKQVLYEYDVILDCDCQRQTCPKPGYSAASAYRPSSSGFIAGNTSPTGNVGVGSAVPDDETMDEFGQMFSNVEDFNI